MKNILLFLHDITLNLRRLFRRSPKREPLQYSPDQYNMNSGFNRAPTVTEAMRYAQPETLAQLKQNLEIMKREHPEREDDIASLTTAIKLVEKNLP